MTPLPSYPTLFAITVCAYLIGGLPFGYWVVRLLFGRDVRTLGSGNIGATNVYRSAGRKAGLIVLLLDIAKGIFALTIAGVVTHDTPVALALAAAAVIFGHCYPAFLRFKGGKGVACFIGAFLYIAPIALAVAFLILVAVVALTKYISLGSIVAVLLFPILIWLINRPSRSILIASIFIALLIVYRHKANIWRLLHRQENVFSLKGGSLS